MAGGNQEVRVFTYDLMTSKLLAELPFEGVKWGRKLNAAGTFSAKLNLADPGVKDSNWTTGTRPARTLLVVDVDGAIEWAGILWDPTYDSPSRTLSVSATEAWSYFSRRLQSRDYTTPPANGAGHAYWSTNPAASYDVVAALVIDAIGVAGSAFATMAIDVRSSETPETITVSYPLTQRQTLDSLVTQLAQGGLGTGFDFSIEWQWSDAQGSTPLPTFALSFPRAGRIAGETGVVVDAGQAGAKGYTWPVAGSQMANSIRGTASGAGSLYDEVTDPTPLSDGYPLLEAVESYMAINDAGALRAADLGNLAILEWPVTTPTVTVPMFGSISLGDFAIGDTLRLVIPPDKRLPKGLDTYMRVVQLDSAPGDQGVPLMTFTFAAPPGLAPVPPPPGA